MNGENPKIQNLITEDELKELFGISKPTLSRLRLEEGLPYLRISMTRRLYLESDVIDWLIGRRRHKTDDANG